MIAGQSSRRTISAITNAAISAITIRDKGIADYEKHRWNRSMDPEQRTGTEHSAHDKQFPLD
jgi:hypothetical protein